MKRIGLVVIAVLLGAVGAHASASSIYLAQTAQGAGTGADCADAKAVSFFNSSGNWGSSGTQIGAGTTVYLCSGGGEITTNLSFQGNGSSGGTATCGPSAACTPVTLDGTNATMDATVSIGTNYWIVQDLTYDTSFSPGNEPVINTVHGANASYGTIQSNHIDVQSASQFIFVEILSHDILIQNNYLKNTTPSGGDGYQSDGLDSEGSYNVLVQGNYMALDIGAGDNSCGDCHDDPIQVWAASGDTANSPYNWTIRYNEIVQESSPSKQQNLSMGIFEQIGGGTAGYWDIYSNVYHCISGGSMGNGIVFDSNYSGMTAHLFNNTIVEDSGGCNNLLNISGSGSFYLENNIVYNTDAGNALTGGETFTARNNNLWYGANLPSCSGFTGDVCGSNPDFTNYSGGDFTLASGSPARGAGANLGTSYNAYPIAETTWPNPTLGTRPATGNWDAGAYQFSSGGGGGSGSPAPAATAIAVQ